MASLRPKRIQGRLAGLAKAAGLGSQVSGQSRFQTQPIAAATAKKMTAVAIRSLMSNAEATRAPPQMGRQSRDPDTDAKQHDLADPDHDCA
jgi:hypothetical protein